MDKRKTGLREIVLLAAPHTWAASCVPALLSAVLARVHTGRVSLVMALLTLLISVLMQSAVNAFDDYSDYIRGTDTMENSPESYDAVIVYGMPPKTALLCGIGFLTAAALLGAYVVAVCGVIPLYIGLTGGAVVLLYAFGRKPLSYLPFGELVSGLVMGGLIPLAGYYMQTGTLRFAVLIEALPVMLGIALIMFSNNACDIVRDTAAGRKTFACLMGRERTQSLYKALLVLWLLLPVFVSARSGITAAAAYVLCLPLSAPGFARQIKTAPDEKRRAAVMGGIVRLNTTLGLSYMLALLIGGGVL